MFEALTIKLFKEPVAEILFYIWMKHIRTIKNNPAILDQSMHSLITTSYNQISAGEKLAWESEALVFINNLLDMVEER